jgi:hypothetical protein
MITLVNRNSHNENLIGTFYQDATTILSIRQDSLSVLQLLSPLKRVGSTLYLMLIAIPGTLVFQTATPVPDVSSLGTIRY